MIVGEGTGEFFLDGVTTQVKMGDIIFALFHLDPWTIDHSLHIPKPGYSATCKRQRPIRTVNECIGVMHSSSSGFRAKGGFVGKCASIEQTDDPTL